MNIHKLFQAGCRYIANPNYRFLIHANFGRYDSMPDEKYLRKKFKASMGKPLDLAQPRTFNEKLQWLKLYDRKPEYTMMVDKYLVRDYIARQLGEEYLIPLLGVWEDPDEIDFDALPNQFVLKCNHNSGLGMCICKDKSKLDIPKVKKELRKGLKQNYYLTGREWPYKDVPRKIICEQYMTDGGEGLADYKFYCFGGKPTYCQVITDRNTEEHIDFFDMDWEHLEFTGLALPHKPFSNTPIPIPISFETMKQFAETLSKNIPFLRVDFYEVNGHLYFGELTFYPASGFGVFTPKDWNERIGDMLTLPKRLEIE